MGSILTVALPILIILSAFNLFRSGDQLVATQALMEERLISSIRSSLGLIDASMRMLERAVADRLAEASLRVSWALRDETLPTPGALDDLASRQGGVQGGRFDFTIVDERGRVLAASVLGGRRPPAGESSRYLLADRARRESSFVAEPATIAADGSVAMTGWLGLPGGKAVVQADFKSAEYGAFLDRVSVPRAVAELKTLSPDITAIRVYTRDGLDEAAIGSTPDPTMEPVLSRLWGTGLGEMRSFDREALLVRRYLYIDPRARSGSPAGPGTSLSDDAASARVVEIAISVADLYRDLSANIAFHVFLILALAVASTVAAVFVSDRVVAPMRRLARGACEVSAGDLDLVLPSDSGLSELAELSDAINLMVSSLKGSIARARASEKEVMRYNEDLEGIVRERTALLEAANRDLSRSFRKTKEELTTARMVQEALMPRTAVTADGVDCAGIYRPIDELGGDYFDIIGLGPGRFGLVVADVIGHGVSASLVAAIAKFAFTSEFLSGRPVPEIAARVNREVGSIASDTDRYFTAIFGVLDVGAGSFEYVNAGHVDGVLLRADGSIETLPACAGIVGAFDEESYSSRKVDVAQGDVLALYSDGAVEARDRAGELFGRDRLVDILWDRRHEESREICDAIYRGAGLWLDGLPAEDDVTVLVARLGDAPEDASLAPLEDDPEARTFGCAFQGSLKSQWPMVAQIDEGLGTVLSGLKGFDSHAILAAVEEAVANVFAHSYHGREGLLRFQASYKKGELSIVLADRGRGGRAFPRGPLAAPETGKGRGLWIITSVFDVASYERRGGENVLILRKRLEDNL